MDATLNNTTVAVLGLGAMGSRVARRLLDSGCDVRVWNRTRSAADELVRAGAHAAEDPGEAAAGAAYVLSIVTDDDAAREIWLGPRGAAGALGPGATAIEVSTVTPDWIRELADAVAERRAAFVESPVIGSRPQAEAGQLISLAGGRRADVDRARPVLGAFSGRVFFIGDAGLGAIAKLAVNTFFATQLAAAGELVHFLRQGGIEDERWLDLFSNLPVVAPPVAASMKGMAAARYAPMFPISLVEKDLRYFLATADGHRVAHPIATAVQALFADAVERGLGSDNIHGIAQVFDPVSHRGRVDR